MEAREHFDAGRLADAVAAATDAVRRAPADANRRGLLCELLCFAGDFERADKQLDALNQLDPQTGLGAALFRHLLRAEQARQQFYAEGRVPEFLAEPTEELKTRLQASIAAREGNAAEAKRLLDRAEELRPHAAGACDGQAFDDIRDLDDLTAGVFEVLTSTGKYYWVPVAGVESVEFRPPARPRDLLWRRARMVVRGGPDGEVYLPTLYPGSAADPDNALRLGRATDWRGGAGEPVRGAGLRTYLVGEEPRTILELNEVAFSEEPRG